MIDYISREAAVELLSQPITMSLCLSVDECQHKIAQQQIDCYLIENIPAADVRPVKRGKWVGYPECLKYTNAYSDDHIVCSACEECFSILDNDCERFNFCPNCGAMMEES